MIQRIQTIFLFLAFLLEGSVFFNAIYDHAMADPQSWIGISFSILLVVGALVSLICIFLYKSRSNQLRWVSLGMIPQVLAFGIGIGIYVSLGGFGTYLWDETIGLLLLLLALASQIYAHKKIKDDIELVKSMDRIR